jgi:hypothetical protein
MAALDLVPSYPGSSFSSLPHISCSRDCVKPATVATNILAYKHGTCFGFLGIEGRVDRSGHTLCNCSTNSALRPYHDYENTPDLAEVVLSSKHSVCLQERFWVRRLLDDAGRCWTMLDDAGRCYTMPMNSDENRNSHHRLRCCSFY